MPSCILHVSGEDFAVDEFLSDTKLKPYHVHHRGEPTGRKEVNYEDSGFSIEVSEADGDLNVEVEDAILFLRRHEADLSRLATMHEVSVRRLDFGINRRDVFGQFEYLPPELLLLSGRLGIGIELSIYDSSDSDS